jgi:hypothetical protein
MNYNTCKKIINNAKNYFTKNDRYNCPGKMVITIIDGNVGCPSFPPPFHLCGNLTNIKNMDLGQRDHRSTLEMITPTILTDKILYLYKRQALIKLIGDKVHWHGLTVGRFSGVRLRQFVPDLAHQADVNKVVGNETHH